MWFVTSTGPTHPDLQAFGPVARAAVMAAAAEARSLGHDRIGTEHLLLGLLTREGTSTVRVLNDAGVHLPVARHKVLQVLPATVGGARAPGGSAELTARAARAIRRSVRFSHTRRTEHVTPEDLLIGVLDVEGTAGQVLRGLGVDVDAVRAALEPGGAGPPADGDAPAVAAPADRVEPEPVAAKPSGYVDRPDYRVDILARRNLVRAWFDGKVLAETTRPLLVDEQDHGLVFYFPRDDVRMERLQPTDTRTRCPYKGEASYWRVDAEGGDDVAWSYEDPYPEVERLRGCVAFYQDRVGIEVRA